MVKVMAALPPLLASGAVVFESDEDLRASIDTYLSRGALALAPSVGLEPLSVVVLRLEGGWLKEPIPLRCEVVGLQPERVLLRLIGADLEQLGRRLAEPVAEEPPVLITLPPVADKPPKPEDTEPAEPPLMPPMLRGEVLRFASEEDFNAAGRDLYTHGAVMAVVDEPFQPGAKRTVRLQVQDRESRSSLVASMQPGSMGTAVLQFESKEQLAALLPELLPPKAPPEIVRDGGEEPAATAPRIALTLAPSGALTNPTTVAELLALSLAEPLNPERLGRPNIHLLLRWLLGTHGFVRVEVEHQGAPAHPFLIVNGREVRASVPLSILARGLVGLEGRYVTTKLKRAPRLSQYGTVLQLMQEVVSALVARFSDEELEAGLQRYGKRSPQLNAAGKKLLEGLGFSSSHKRLAQKALTGRESVLGVTQHASGARAAFEVLYTLEITGALDWVDAGGLLLEEKRRKDKERLDRLVEGAAGMWDKIKGANHFEVMGLHWSTPPRKIPESYQELAKLYGPTGEARAEAPDVCQLIWAKVGLAYDVLKDTSARRRYRHEVYALKWSAQVELLIDRAKLAIYRHDAQDAVDLLSVCQDIHPTQEAAELLTRLQAGSRDTPA
jgi:hypothetical protein